ncbi:DUF6159 family protein [Haladaptatus sp. F3-133]|uniref:DUF6159 family protein n=1 Tax=Halorutilus salinus TaxID=2487751 RepID=A0A9Q4GJD2_9EURY|nr:DUF6159 family protein [Halorutilus salinus]MCX2819111.1 DUF6159 family protein [Halorutilus salinus]
MVFGRIRTGFGMARRSGRVLRDYPKLLVFPVIGGVSGIAFLATLFGGLFVAGSIFEEGGAALYGALFTAYLVETFVASFFSAALVSETREVLNGGEPSVRRGARTAWSHKLPLLAWSVIAAVIGVVIQLIESQDNTVARLLASVFAVAWGVMTYFVVPVIVFRDPSVRGMFEESARTFKNTWGESVGAMGAINIVTFVLALAGVAVAGGVFFLIPTAGGARLVLTVLIGGSAVVFGVLVGKTLTGVAKTALYIYATENEPPDYFEDMGFAEMGGDGKTARDAGVLGGRV